MKITPDLVSLFVGIYTSPMPSQDHFSIMVARHCYSGPYTAVDFYQKLHDEVRHKAEARIGVIANEKRAFL